MDIGLFHNALGIEKEEKERGNTIFRKGTEQGKRKQKRKYLLSWQGSAAAVALDLLGDETFCD